MDEQRGALSYTWRGGENSLLLDPNKSLGNNGKRNFLIPGEGFLNAFERYKKIWMEMEKNRVLLVQDFAVSQQR